jgi:hypothetical protein
LQSIRAEVESGWAELLLVDNASPDASVEIGMNAIPQARILRLDENRGFAGGVNVALAEAQGRHILLLNPDVAVPAHGLREMAVWMEAHPSVGAASPDIRNASDGRSECPAQPLPSIARTLWQLSRLHRLLPRRLLSPILLGPYWDGGETRRVGWIPGTAMFVRAEVVAKVGPLSDVMFMYGEDIEWCWLIRRAGYQIGVNPAIAFSHIGSASSIRSWGEAEKNRQTAAGIYRACTIMYGSWHARLLATSVAGSLAADARSPRRSRKHRAEARAASRCWLDLART